MGSTCSSLIVEDDDEDDDECRGIELMSKDVGVERKEEMLGWIE